MTVLIFDQLTNMKTTDTKNRTKTEFWHRLKDYKVYMWSNFGENLLIRFGDVRSVSMFGFYRSNYFAVPMYNVVFGTATAFPVVKRLFEDQ